MSEQLETKLVRNTNLSRTPAWRRRKNRDVLSEEGVGVAREFGVATIDADGVQQVAPSHSYFDLRGISQRLVSVLGVGICDVTRTDALRLMRGLIHSGSGRCHSVFIANAHTLNVATEQRDYRDVLNSADFVFNDGTGVRWASRQRGIELRANLVGTDLIPDFFHTTAGCGYRYFLLGADPDTIEQASAVARERFAGWTQAGYHHGFVGKDQVDDVIKRINSSDADMLLVGMGNPIQERWIHSHQSKLRVPLAIGVGGMFDHWIDKPRRAPLWVRRMGCEWVHKMILQPHKWRRYLLGNPKFLVRMTISKRSDLAAMQTYERATDCFTQSLQPTTRRRVAT